MPAIVLIAEKGYHHFVVIKGMRDGRVLMGDPSSGTRAVSRGYFGSIWVNKLLFVIHNRQKQAYFNQDDDWQVRPPERHFRQESTLEATSGLVYSKLGPGDF